jgi:hypothetical protein
VRKVHVNLRVFHSDDPLKRFLEPLKLRSIYVVANTLPYLYSNFAPPCQVKLSVRLPDLPMFRPSRQTAVPLTNRFRISTYEIS